MDERRIREAYLIGDNALEKLKNKLTREGVLLD